MSSIRMSPNFCVRSEKNKLGENKTDKIDARRLAELLRLNALTAVYHGQDSTRPLKELARSYVSLQQDSTRVMNRVKAIFRGRGSLSRHIHLSAQKS